MDRRRDPFGCRFHWLASKGHRIEVNSAKPSRLRLVDRKPEKVKLRSGEAAIAKLTKTRTMKTILNSIASVFVSTHQFLVHQRVNDRANERAN